MLIKYLFLPAPFVVFVNVAFLWLQSWPETLAKAPPLHIMESVAFSDHGLVMGLPPGPRFGVGFFNAATGRHNGPGAVFKVIPLAWV